MNVQYRWFSRYVIAAMLVDGKQNISPLLFVSPEIVSKPPIERLH